MQSHAGDTRIQTQNYQRSESIVLLEGNGGFIVLSDYIHSGGAFDKTFKVDMKDCFKVPKDQSNPVEGLLSVLRYTTKHLSDSLHGN